MEEEEEEDMEPVMVYVCCLCIWCEYSVCNKGYFRGLR